MGLDNFPKPEPCRVLEKVGKLNVVLDKHGDIDCAATNCPFMQKFSSRVLACWIRGKVFNKYVEESCGESLYKDKTREELEYILHSLKEYYGEEHLMELKNKDLNAYFHVRQLIKYLETLLSIKEWYGKLIAWY